MANATTKHLLNQVGSISEEALLDQGAELFATAILSSEGIEGTMAFINKRAANWFKEWSS
jgi:isohexenylglutaconyl-CoA hydratase